MTFFLLFTCLWVENWTSVSVMTFFLLFTISDCSSADLALNFDPLPFSRGVPRNLKRGGGAQFLVYSFPLKISVKTKKKGLHVFRRRIYPPKSSEDQKKGQRVLRCPVSTVSLTADLYQLISQRGGGGCDPSGSPWIRPCFSNFWARPCGYVDMF